MHLVSHCPDCTACAATSLTDHGLQIVGAAHSSRLKLRSTDDISALKGGKSCTVSIGSTGFMSCVSAMLEPLYERKGLSR